MVCQNSNCLSRGSELLYRALWNALDERKLAYYKTGGSLRLSESGCLGACSFGPVMCVYRHRNGQLEEGWYAAADLPLALEVAQAVHDETELPDKHRYGP